MAGVVRTEQEHEPTPFGRLQQSAWYTLKTNNRELAASNQEEAKEASGNLNATGCKYEEDF